MTVMFWFVGGWLFKGLLWPLFRWGGSSMGRTLGLQGVLTILLVLLTAGVVLAASDRLSAETQDCLGCHQGMPGIVSQWEDSAHWNAGVGCYECHKAEPGDIDAIDHNGFSVAII